MKNARWGLLVMVAAAMLISTGCNYTVIKRDDLDHLQAAQRMYRKQTALVTALVQDKSGLESLIKAAEADRDAQANEAMTAKQQAEAKAKLLAMMQAALDTEQANLQKAQARIAELESEKAELEKQLANLGQGMPEGVEVVQTPLGMALRLPNAILFNSGKADLKQSGAAVITEIAQMPAIQDSANLINVCGFSDSDPITHSTWKDNYQLSGERARAVMLQIIKANVPTDRIYYSGLGPQMLILEDGQENKVKSRRVEIYFRRVKAAAAEVAPEAAPEAKVVPK